MVVTLCCTKLVGKLGLLVELLMTVVSFKVTAEAETEKVLLSYRA